MRGRGMAIARRRPEVFWRRPRTGRTCNMRALSYKTIGLTRGELRDSSCCRFPEFAFLGA
jgi:hypothetical protein